MGKTIWGALLSVFILSSQALATHHHEMIFKGKGRWQSQVGLDGTYDILVKQSVLPDGSYGINTTISKSDGSIKAFAYRLEKDAKGFLTVKDPAGNVIGKGHSHDMGRHHVCHYEMNTSDHERVEITIHGNLDEFHGIGSYENTLDGSYISWEEKADRIFPKDSAE
jgi:hypothetical protein